MLWTLKFLNKWLCLYLCRGHSCPTCMPLLHTSNWNQCASYMHQGCIKDAGSLMLYCCKLFFICLTIFSRMLLKMKAFYCQNKSMLLLLICINSRKNNVAKAYIVQYKIIKDIYFANNMKIDWGERSTFVIAQTYNNSTVKIGIVFLKGYRFSSKFYQIYFIYHFSNLLLHTFPATCFRALQSMDVIYYTLFPSRNIKFYFVIRFIVYLLFLFLPLIITTKW